MMNKENVFKKKGFRQLKGKKRTNSSKEVVFWNTKQGELRTQI
jgi:hypothetical protein